MKRLLAAFFLLLWPHQPQAAISGIAISATNAPSLWADPPMGCTTSAGVLCAPSITQPSQTGDLIGVRIQNTTASTEGAGYITFAHPFLDGVLHSTDTVVARISGTNYYVQMDVKATNADGSVRHAIFTFNAPSIGANSSLDAMLAICSSGCPSAPSPAAPTASALHSSSYDTNLSFTFYLPPPVVEYSTTTGSISPTQPLYFKTTCVNASGETESFEWNNSTNGMAGGYVFTAPSSPGCGSYGSPTGWNVYASTTSGAEKLQNGSPLSLSSTYTLNSGPSTGGASPPSSNTASAGTATASCNTILGNAISGSTVVNWLSGAAVNEFIVQGTTFSGRLKVECDIAAYADGTTITDVVFDNSWFFSNSSVVSDLEYTLSVTQDGYTASHALHYIDERAHHTVNSSGVISPNIQFDVPYIEATKTMPYFDTSNGVASSQVSAYLSSAQAAGLLSLANITPIMSQPGGRADIGPQPNWLTLWFMSQDATARTLMIRNADAGGAVPWQITDENTGEPISGITYTNLFTGTNPTAGYYVNNAYASVDGNIGSNGMQVVTDVTHVPDVDYMAYLFTGSHYYLGLFEMEANFAVYSIDLYGNCVDPITSTTQMGFGCSFYGNGNETRGMAWAGRELIEASGMVPDADALKSYFQTMASRGLSGLVFYYITKDGNSALGQLDGAIEGTNGPNQGGIVPLEQQYAIAGFAPSQIYNDSNGSAMMAQIGKYISGLFNNGANSLNPLIGGTSYWAYVYPATNCVSSVGTYISTWSGLSSNNQFASWSQGNFCYPTSTSVIINEFFSGTNPDNWVIGGYPQMAIGGLTPAITYSSAPGPLLEAFSFDVVEHYYGIIVVNSSSLKGEYQTAPFWNTAPKLPDGRLLIDSNFVIDTSASNSGTLTGTGYDSLLGAHGSGTWTLAGATGELSDVMSGGTGTNTFNPVSGSQTFAFARYNATGAQTFNDNVGNSYGPDYYLGTTGSGANAFKFDVNDTHPKTVVNMRSGTDKFHVKSTLNGGSWTASSVVAACSASGGNLVCNMTNGEVITFQGITSITTSDVVID